MMYKIKEADYAPINVMPVGGGKAGHGVGI